MFDALIREIKRLDGLRVSVNLPADEDGYLDRVCPSEECQFEFKVYNEDWRYTVRDEIVFCPFCRHTAEANEWATEEQMAYAQKAVFAQVQRRIRTAMKHDAERWNQRQSRNNLLRITMKVDDRPRHIFLPASVAEIMRLRITCPACNCRYAVIGAAFFCPACGHNAADQVFSRSLTGIRSTISAVSVIRDSMTDRDTAENTARMIIESSLQYAITAFQRYAEILYEQFPNHPPARRNVFQNLNAGSALWQAVTGKDYQAYVTTVELERLERYFQQRHLLTHRQGIVDADYIAKSGDTNYTTGQRLIIREGSVLECLDLIEKLAAGLASV